MVRMTSNVGTGVRERLVGALDAVCEMTQDFTDSAYTPHHHREQILDFLEEARFEMSNLLRPEVRSSYRFDDRPPYASFYPYRTTPKRSAMKVSK